MPEIRWARGSQFNWVFDNMGGAPLMEILAGNWSGAQYSLAVAPDGKVYIQTPLPGGGSVAYLRGVWKFETVFPWNGFWADPESGDLTNYFTGGSHLNSGTQTQVTLGTSLAPGTVVQVYYLYYTGETGVKGQALNNTPCVRPAVRGRADYTYDFAVDRLLDLMAVLAFAGPERGRDYSRLIKFLWDNFYPYQTSRTSPLLLDNFERQQWSNGAFLMYRDSSLGVQGYEKFAIELYPGDDDDQDTGLAEAAQGPRALRVILKDFSATTFQAWWGYGMNWSLAVSPLADISRVRFKLRGLAAGNRVHNICKTSNGGSATMVLKGTYNGSNPLNFVIQAQDTGEIGTARFRWSDNRGQSWNASNCKTGGPDAPVSLGNGLEVFWEPGPGNDFVNGDFWTFTTGDPEIFPRRLLVVLNDSAPGDADPWGPAHTFVHALPDRYGALTQFEIDFSQFKTIDNLIDDRDRRRPGWGSWYSAGAPDSSDIIRQDREVQETIEGDIYYTTLQVETKLTAQVTAWGVFTGLNTSEVNSTGKTNVNFLIYPMASGYTYLGYRLKVKDANGSYFYKDFQATVGQWNRVTVNFADLNLDWGHWPLAHPLQMVEIGIPSSPPSDTSFRLTDVRFNDTTRFSGAQRLRLLEFKYPEINQDLEQAPAWWLDDAGADLEAGDAYPYAPRLAVSLTPYGQNTWRGPTPVHYAHPLGPYLLNRLDLVTNFLNFHRDAQNEFNNRYGGVKGPVLPVHTRNDIENIPLCGEEDFTRFSWWKKYRDYGLVSGAWPFNGALTDASGHNHTLAWSSGSPTYATGVCQPGNTAIAFDGAAHASLASNALFVPGLNPFSITLIIKGNSQAGDYRWVADKMAADGWVVQTKTAGSLDLQLKVTTSAGDSYSDIAGVLDGSWHLVTWMIVPADAKIYRIKDGVLLGDNNLAVGSGLLNTAYLNLGASAVFHLDYFKYERRALPAAEYENAWNIVQGLANGSAYPEVGHALAQYWSFYRLAEYYFTSNDPAAWEILENWLNWFNTYLVSP
jgi:hypothetical protein